MTAKPVLMKGESFKKYGHKATFPAIVEIKHDGIRVRLTLTDKGLEVESYARKTLHNIVPLLGKKGEEWMRYIGVNELDIEFLVNGNFNDTYRYVRSKVVPKDLIDADVCLILLDAPEVKEPYSIRRHTVSSYAEIGHGRFDLPTIDTFGELVDSEAEMWQFYGWCRDRGHEGVMYKELDHEYSRKRTRSWLKVKPEETFDGKIIGINRATSIEGVPLDRAGSITVQLEDGSIAQPAGLKHELGADMFRNPSAYLGRWVEFKCMERDRQGGYRHPFFYRFREDKD